MDKLDYKDREMFGVDKRTEKLIYTISFFAGIGIAVFLFLIWLIL
jgi:hypothetical protein